MSTTISSDRFAAIIAAASLILVSMTDQENSSEMVIDLSDVTLNGDTSIKSDWQISIKKLKI